MNESILDDVRKYVNDNIGEFHNKRLNSLNSLSLKKVLKRKNPYLYKTKNLQTSEMIVREIVDAHISSNEETIFGDWLEGLAIFINNKIYEGWKSGIPGIDLEFDKDNIRYIVNIKSGPNWGNRAQKSKMIEDFTSAKRTLRTSNSKLIIVSVNGCCYGKEANPDKGEYFKYCGQDFWKFISGNNDLYIEIIEPLGFDAKRKNDEYLKIYSSLINRFTSEFSTTFCKNTGEIDWEKLVKFNSSSNSNYIYSN